MAAPGVPRMQFPTEFDWVAPSGRALLTCFMADHYSAGWWLESSPTLEQADGGGPSPVHRTGDAGRDAERAAADGHRLLAAQPLADRDPARLERPVCLAASARRAIPRDFFDAVRAEMASRGRRFTPQTRDMNPIYTGKDVSFIDTKQAQRLAENTLLTAEKFGTIASQLGARYPSEAADKAWRQLLYGAHHDGITGSESDQVYLDLMGGWREALELARSALDSALDHLASQIDTSGDSRAVTVFNPSSWPRTDVVHIPTADLPDDEHLVDDAGARMPVLMEAGTVSFIAKDVPALGYRTYRLAGDDCRRVRSTTRAGKRSTATRSRTRHTRRASIRAEVARSSAWSTSGPARRSSRRVGPRTSCWSTANIRTTRCSGRDRGI